MLKNSSLSEIKISDGKTGESGFTIVEVIISMVIFLIVTGAVYGVLQIAQRSRNTVNQEAYLTKNVRLSLNLLGRDTYNAGLNYPLKNSVKLGDDKMSTLIGIPNDAGGADDVIQPVIAGNNVRSNTFATPNTTTDQVTFLFKDTTFNIVGTVGPPDTRVSQSSIITPLAPTGGVNQVTVTSGSAVCQLKDIFVLTGASGSTLGVVTAKDDTTGIVQFANNDILGFNQNGGGTILVSTAPITMFRVTLVTYFVTADGILTRREFANNSTLTSSPNYTDEPLVYGVEDFQIQYILADGTLADNPSVTQLSTVRQIRFTVSAKSVEVDQAGQPYQTTLTSTFSTRNLGYNPN